MHRLAKEHNQQPSLGILTPRHLHLARSAASQCSKTKEPNKICVQCRNLPVDIEYAGGAWFMWHALQGTLCLICICITSYIAFLAVPFFTKRSKCTNVHKPYPSFAAVASPSALLLSVEHRKHFLSTLVMLITGQSVRSNTTDPSIMFSVLELFCGWVSAGGAPLTTKELLVIMQRIAQVCQQHGSPSMMLTLTMLQVDRLQVIPAKLKPLWDFKFLSMVYSIIADSPDKEFALDVFNRVERTFCCGLQTANARLRRKVHMSSGFATY